MMRHLKWALFSTCLLAMGEAKAAYVGAPPLLVVPANSAAQVVGSAYPGLPTIPLVVSVSPPFAPVPTPPAAVGRNATFLDAIGRAATAMTDGVRSISVVPPLSSAAPGQSSLVVALSPNPALQCPYIAPINQTASTTVITNPGNKSIHVCSVLLLNATAQGVSLSEGTGTVCATGTIFWDGGAGGTGQLSTTGGFIGTGDRITYPMQKPGDNVCVLQSGSTNLSGHLTYGVY